MIAFFYFLFFSFLASFFSSFLTFNLVGPMEQLDQIANVIGESYATADLSDLLSFLKKEDGDGEEVLEMEEEEEKMEMKQEQRIVDTTHYKIKCHILRFFFPRSFSFLFFSFPFSSPFFSWNFLLTPLL